MDNEYDYKLYSIKWLNEFVLLGINSITVANILDVYNKSQEHRSWMQHVTEVNPIIIFFK